MKVRINGFCDCGLLLPVSFLCAAFLIDSCAGYRSRLDLGRFLNDLLY